MDTISDKILIDKFLRDELLENELLLFNARKKEDDFLMLLEESIIAYQGRLALKEKLKGIGNELKTENTKPVNKPLRWVFGIAASILLFFTIQFFNTKTLTSDELFSSYFETYPNAYAIKGSSDNTTRKEALQFYDNEQYELAIKAFKKIASTRKLNSSEHFYYGISSLAMDNAENAKTQLNKVTEEHPLYNEAQWYTSLALIKQDSLDKAKTVLNNNELNFNTYRNDTVKKLLNQLK